MASVNFRHRPQNVEVAFGRGATAVGMHMRPGHTSTLPQCFRVLVLFLIQNPTRELQEIAPFVYSHNSYKRRRSVALLKAFFCGKDFMPTASGHRNSSNVLSMNTSGSAYLVCVHPRKNVFGPCGHILKTC